MGWLGAGEWRREKELRPLGPLDGREGHRSKPRVTDYSRILTSQISPEQNPRNAGWGLGRRVLPLFSLEKLARDTGRDGVGDVTGHAERQFSLSLWPA